MEIFSLLTVPTVVQMIVAALFIYAYIIIITRIAGKRTFAKMTSLDFAVTIAMGSILADAVNKPVSSLMPAVVSIAVLAVLQVLFSKILSASDKAQQLLTNAPLLLMKGEVILTENLNKALVSEADLMAKLREANVIRLSQVKAVVFETTGDISVLHSAEDQPIEPLILKGIKEEAS